MSPALEAGPAAREVRLLPTTIARVTVYRNGALVERRGSGQGAVEVRDLPLLFASDTLRVRPARGRVRALEETVKLLARPAPPPVSEEEQQRILLELAAVDDELSACDLLLEVLRGLSPELPDPRAGEPGRLVDARLFVDLVGFAGGRAAEVAARRLVLEKRRRALEEERRRLDERAAAVPAETPKLKRGARFVLEDGDPGGGGDVPFVLEYFVPAARWVPSYALHLASDGQRPARLVTAALIAQATGEDWSDVELSVSTADLARDTTLPVPSSWRIGRAQPPPLRGFRPLPTDLPSLFWSYDRAPRRPARAPAAPAGGTGGRPPPSPAASDRPRLGEPDALDDLSDLGALDEGGLFPTNAMDEVNELEEPSALDHDELRAFEQERSSTPRMSLGAARAFEEAGTEPELMAMPAVPAGAPAEAPPPAQKLAAPEMAKEAKLAPTRAAALASRAPGGGGRRRADEPALVQARTELPPRWRTAYLRMAGPDEAQRGQLLPLDPVARLEWLLVAHDVEGSVEGSGDADAVRELRRAVAELERAQARLEQAPLPRGTSLLLGTHFQAVLTAAARTEVPGDGTFYRVEVRTDEGPATVEHRAVPRESNDVWRACRLEVKGPPLPSGPLAVFEDGAFKVNARLDGSGPGKPLDVNLGVDPDVRVLSRTVHTKQAEKGLMGQTSRVEHQVRVELRSTAKQPVQVTLFDRLPVPADNVKDVTVTVLEERPPLQRTAKDALGNEVVGAFEWRARLVPGDSQAFELKYAIDLPAKAELEGGNRRE